MIEASNPMRDNGAAVRRILLAILGLSVAVVLSHEVVNLSSDFSIGRAVQSSIPVIGILALMMLVGSGDLGLMLRPKAANSLMLVYHVAILLASSAVLAWVMVYVASGYALTYAIVGLMVTVAIAASSVLMVTSVDARALVVFLCAWPFLEFLEWSLPNTWLGGISLGSLTVSPSMALVWWFGFLAAIKLLIHGSGSAKTSFSKYLALWVSLLFVSSVASGRQDVSLNEFVITGLCLPVLGLLVVGSIRTHRDLYGISLAFVVYCFLRMTLVYYFVLRGSSDTGIDPLGVYGSSYVVLNMSAVLGSLALAILPFAVAAIRATSWPPSKSLALVVAFYSAFMVVVTRERTQLAVLALSIVGSSWFTTGRRGRLCLLLVIPVALGAILMLPSTFLDAIAGRFTKLDSIDTVLFELRPRLDAWQVAVRLMIEHPILGIGMGSWADYYPKMTSSPASFWRADYRISSAHNMFLQLGATSGILSMLLFLGLLAVSIRNVIRFIKRTSRPWGLAVGTSIGVSLSAYAIAAMTGGEFFYKMNSGTLVLDGGAIFWLLVGLSFGLVKLGPDAGSVPVEC